MCSEYAAIEPSRVLETSMSRSGGMSAHSQVGEGHCGITGSDGPRLFARAVRCCWTDCGRDLGFTGNALARSRCETLRPLIIVVGLETYLTARQNERQAILAQIHVSHSDRLTACDRLETRLEFLATA